MQTEKFTRKTFIVDAVQVTEENMEQVAKWCKGTVQTTDPKIAEGLHEEPLTFIKVSVLNPLNPRQTQAFVGDWVLYAKQGFKVYTEKGFSRSFDPVFKPEEKHVEHFRSAETGEYVSEKTAEENPETTVKEIDKPGPVPTAPKTMSVND